MNWFYVAPILLLCCSNVFMTFAWARSGPAKPDEKRQWRFASDERAELGRGAGVDGAPCLFSRGN